MRLRSLVAVIAVAGLISGCHHRDPSPPDSRFGFARVSLTLYDWEHTSPLWNDPPLHFHTSSSGPTQFILIWKHVEVDSMGRCRLARTDSLGEPLLYSQTTLSGGADSILRGIENWRLEGLRTRDRDNFSHPWRAIVIERKDGSRSMAIGDWLGAPAADLPFEFLRLDSLLRAIKGDRLLADSIPAFEFQTLADSIGKRHAERDRELSWKMR